MRFLWLALGVFAFWMLALWLLSLPGVQAHEEVRTLFLILVV